LVEDANTPLGEDSAAAETGPVSGLFKSLANLVATVIAIAQTRVELLTTELQEEIHRAAEILVWTLVALLAAAMGLFLTALVIIFVFWDTHRVLASVIVASSFFAIALTALAMLRAKVRNRPRLLEGTLAELAKDREQLKRRR
jgi:uncharacterized membrane protein YqjE